MIETTQQEKDIENEHCKLRCELYCLKRLYQQNRKTKDGLSKRIISTWKSFGVMATYTSSWTNTYTITTDLNNVGWRYAQHSDPITSVRRHLHIYKQKLADDEDFMQQLKWYQFRKRLNIEWQIITDKEDARILSLLSDRYDKSDVLQSMTEQMHDIDIETNVLYKRMCVLENCLRIECDKYLEFIK
jgi:hypothetical protein